MDQMRMPEELDGIAQELNFIIGVLEKVVDASGMASHFRELLSIELQKNGRIRKTYLKALKKEMLVVARETMSSKSWAQFKAMLALDELFGEAYLQKIRADGVLRSEDDYRKTLIELDILIHSLEGNERQTELELLISGVDAVLAKSTFSAAR